MELIIRRIHSAKHQMAFGPVQGALIGNPTEDVLVTVISDDKGRVTVTTSAPMEVALSKAAMEYDSVPISVAQFADEFGSSREYVERLMKHGAVAASMALTPESVRATADAKKGDERKTAAEQASATKPIAAAQESAASAAHPPLEVRIEAPTTVAPVAAVPAGPAATTIGEAIAAVTGGAGVPAA